MRVEGVTITGGFKRFQDLQLGPIPETARLVVLLGPNGSGKSSFLEALLYWHKANWNRHVRRNMDQSYYWRPAQVSPPAVDVRMYGDRPADPVQLSRAFHFRSAYRYTSDFSSTSVQALEPIEQTNPIEGLVEEDKSVKAHYNRLMGQGLAAFTDLTREITNTEAYAENVTPLADSFQRLCPSLRLTGLGDATKDGTFLFTKGSATDFRYINLSAGEKAAFDLLLDLHIRRLDYPESVICLDEPEAHIGLRMQGQLLDEILGIIPGTQLWIATHSPGMMRRAFELAQGTTDEIIFLDFDGHDFDAAVEIRPSVPGRALWTQVNKVTLEDLASLVAARLVFVCEGNSAAKGTKRAFDASVFRIIFGDAFPDVDFASFGGVTESPDAASAVMALMRGSEVRRVIDRDSKTDQEVADLVAEDDSLCVLRVRDLENYLLSDEILGLAARSYRPTDGEEAVRAVLAKKAELLATQTYPDDVKAIAGDLFEFAKTEWGLSQPGQDRHGFLRDICAPLITTTTATFRLLRADLRL